MATGGLEETVANQEGRQRLSQESGRHRDGEGTLDQGRDGAWAVGGDREMPGVWRVGGCVLSCTWETRRRERYRMRAGGFLFCQGHPSPGLQGSFGTFVSSLLHLP